MSWQAWVGLWAVLFLGAVVVLALLALRLWRQARALLAEVGRAGDSLEAVAAAVDGIGTRTGDVSLRDTRTRPESYAARPEAAYDSNRQWRRDE